jgi:hypothetical protein
MISSAPNNGLKGVEFQSLLTPNKCQESVLNFNMRLPVGGEYHFDQKEKK